MTDVQPKAAPQQSAEAPQQQDGAAEATRAPKDFPEAATVAKIEQLLQVKDDTSRFVALALLKALLDNQPDGPEAPEGEQTPPAPPLPLDAVLRLWKALPVKFLDRLLKAGRPRAAAAASMANKNGQVDAANKRDLAVAVLHTFAVRLLPEDQKGDPRLVGRIPLLVMSLLSSGSSSSSSSIPPSASASSAKETQDTATLTLQTLTVLVSRPEGAAILNSLDAESLSPLTELAPAQPLVLQILLRSWLYGLFAGGDNGDAAAAATSSYQTAAVASMDAALPSLVAAFKGTDGVTLLDFLAKLLRNASALSEQQRSPSLLPRPNLAWLQPAIGFIRRLTINRPTAAARAAYTHAAAALLRVYPVEAPALLFADSDNHKGKGTASSNDDKPFAYLFVSLLLVDLRASLPGLLALLNTPQYGPTAARLASAYDILSAFIGYLVRSLDLDDDDTGSGTAPTVLPPDSLLRLRTAIAESLSATAEHLRDRWDAAVAGAQGLHPDVRPGTTGNHHGAISGGAVGLPLTWDAAQTDSMVTRDTLVLAAVRALALWLREDDNPVLRREVAGLGDMLVDLYRESTFPTGERAAKGRTEKDQQDDILDFRPAVLVALEGLTAIDDDENGMSDSDQSITDELLGHGMWAALTADMEGILRSTTNTSSFVPGDAARGTEIVRVLLPIVERARPGTPEKWMDVVTHVAAWAGPGDGGPQDETVNEFQVAVLQLVTALVANAHPAVVQRYTHSLGAVIGLARQLRQCLTGLKDSTASTTTAFTSALTLVLVESLDDVLATLEALRR